MTVVSLFEPTSADRLEASDVALFLDLDGTLVEVEDSPADVQADSACIDLLRRARDRLSGRLAVLSGRPVMEVDSILQGAVNDVAGVHGLQMRTARWGLVAEPAHPAVAEAAAVFDDFAAADAGLLVERKGHSVALHYRLAPGAGEAVIEFTQRLASETGLAVQHGSMVAELRTPGPDKGAALSRLMGHPPFSGARPIMIGDDLTDEAAFVEAQLRGGIGVRVGAERPTAAVGRLDEPRSVLSWIDRSLSSGVFDLEDAQWGG
ncbi:MAG: trehalose-phosphatase [Caulobacterales bacterium 68-7]|nr:trehalose-phosphatase [Caulobacterales bacterium]OJU10438.1 MAG: trehalose-phosphatase [Caulobacterales bacterium 68-7]